MNEARCILAIDQSTTGTKAVLFNSKGKIVYKCNKEHAQYYPQIGWVEHDPEELYQNVTELIFKVIDNADVAVDQIASISLTNQRETTLIWDKLTGEPVYNAIVWQCNRAADICNRIEERGLAKKIKEITGMPLSAYFSASKLSWIVENVDGVKQLMKDDRLLCGTIDSWIVWKISTEKAHVTDYSNASRTQLFNLSTCDWDNELLEIFSLKASMMPSIVSSNSIVGHMRIKDKQIPIAGIMGDSHGALFAQVGFKQGMKVTYGTGSSIMMNIGKEILMDDKLSTSIAYGYSDKVFYAIEGNINSTGATIKWMEESMELVLSIEDAEKLAGDVENTEGVYFVPAFVGLGAPYWNANTRALICGMSFNTKRRHIVRAAIESIAYQIKDIVDCIETCSGKTVSVLKVDGKPTENDLLMNFQADMLQKSIIKSCIQEASAFGSALMAGLAIGIWQEDDIEDLIGAGDVVNYNLKKEQADKLYKGWQNAIRVTQAYSAER